MFDLFGPILALTRGSGGHPCGEQWTSGYWPRWLVDRSLSEKCWEFFTHRNDFLLALGPRGFPVILIMSYLSLTYRSLLAACHNKYVQISCTTPMSGIIVLYVMRIGFGSCNVLTKTQVPNDVEGPKAGRYGNISNLTNWGNLWWHGVMPPPKGILAGNLSKTCANLRWMKQ